MDNIIATTTTTTTNHHHGQGLADTFLSLTAAGVTTTKPTTGSNSSPNPSKYSSSSTTIMKRPLIRSPSAAPAFGISTQCTPGSTFDRSIFNIPLALAGTSSIVPVKRGKTSDSMFSSSSSSIQAATMKNDELSSSLATSLIQEQEHMVQQQQEDEEARNPGNGRSSVDNFVVACTCPKTKCLKLYCVCFEGGFYCTEALCKCRDCKNYRGSEQLKAAKKRILQRRPDAFGGSAKRKERLGCRCKRNRCLKKYCPCFAESVICTNKCQCKDCGNDAVAAAAMALDASRRQQEQHVNSDPVDDGQYEVQDEPQYLQHEQELQQSRTSEEISQETLSILGASPRHGWTNETAYV